MGVRFSRSSAKLDGRLLAFVFSPFDKGNTPALVERPSRHSYGAYRCVFYLYVCRLGYATEIFLGLFQARVGGVRRFGMLSSKPFFFSFFSFLLFFFAKQDL